MKDISSISEIIPGIIKTLGLEKKSIQMQIMLDWKEIVGKRISEESMPVTVKRGILKVKVSSSAWMNELQMMKPELMERIEKRFGRNRIRDIRFCLGRIQNKT